MASSRHMIPTGPAASCLSNGTATITAGIEDEKPQRHSEVSLRSFYVWFVCLLLHEILLLSSSFVNGRMFWLQANQNSGVAASLTPD